MYKDGKSPPLPAALVCRGIESPSDAPRIQHLQFVPQLSPAPRLDVKSAAASAHSNTITAGMAPTTAPSICQVLCADCHKKEHQRRRAGRKR
jgi:hypothetical protein